MWLRGCVAATVVQALCESKEFFESRVRVGAAGRFTMRDGVKQGVLPDGAKLRARGGQTSRIAGGYQGRLKLNVDQSTMVRPLLLPPPTFHLPHAPPAGCDAVQWGVLTMMVRVVCDGLCTT